MANAANLTVKKADGTTDIIYDVQVGAGGGDPAIWRQDTGAAAGLPAGLRATLRFNSKWNSSKTARQCEIQFSYPYAVQDSTTTRYSATDMVVGKYFVTLPQNIPANVLSEAAHQFSNLLANSAVKAQLAAGYAPT